MTTTPKPKSPPPQGGFLDPIAASDLDTFRAQSPAYDPLRSIPTNPNPAPQPNMSLVQSPSPDRRKSLGKISRKTKENDPFRPVTKPQVLPHKMPTRALRAVNVLTQPRYRHLTMAQKANLARCSIQYIRRIAASKEVEEMVRDLWAGELRDGFGAIAESMTASAMIPGRDGFKDRELVAKITGILPDYRGTITVGGEVKHTHRGRIDVGDRLDKALRDSENPQDVVSDRPIIDVNSTEIEEPSEDNDVATD